MDSIISYVDKKTHHAKLQIKDNETHQEVKEAYITTNVNYNANLENTYTENSEYIDIGIYVLLVIDYKPNIC